MFNPGSNDVGTNVAKRGFDAIHRLPTELFDVIFESLLAQDYRKRSILSCSLVSRLWRLVTLKFCFRSLSLVIPIAGEDVTRAAEVKSCTIQRFLRSSIYPIVCSSINWVTLQWGANRGNNIQCDFIDFLPSFLMLRGLTLRGRLHSPLPKSTACRSGSLSVDCLAIDGVLPPERPRGRHNERGLLDILSLFSSILSFKLRGVEISTESYRRAASGNHNFPLTPRPLTLHLHSIAHLPLLKRASFMADVKYLNVNEIWFHLINLVGNTNLDSTVEHLAVSLFHYSSWVKLDIHLFTSLQSLQISVLVDETASPGKKAYMIDSIITVLSTLHPSVQLGLVELHICSESDDGELKPWLPAALTQEKAEYALHELDSLLETLAKSGQVQYVKAGFYSLDLWHPDDRDAFKYDASPSLLRGIFPRLDQMGVLRL